MTIKALTALLMERLRWEEANGWWRVRAFGQQLGIEQAMGDDGPLKIFEWWTSQDEGTCRTLERAKAQATRALAKWLIDEHKRLGMEIQG